jgi:hypothetical protein
MAGGTVSIYTTYARHRDAIETAVKFALVAAAAVVWALVAVHAFGLSFMPDVATWAGNLIAGWLW